jgi:hypothetical protein
VLEQTKDGASTGRLVAAHPLEDRAEELYGRAQEVHGAVLPENEMAILPDPGGFGDA